MYAVISAHTTTFTAIADLYGLPHSSTQPPYKDTPWDLYARNFLRTLLPNPPGKQVGLRKV
jgi:hypothetical protein